MRTENYLLYLQVNMNCFCLLTDVNGLNHNEIRIKQIR